MNKSILLGSGILVFCVVLFFLGIRRTIFWEHSSCVQRSSDPSFDFQQIGKFKIPYHKPVDSIQSNKVSVVFKQITEAYVGMDVTRIKVLTGEIPDYVFKMEEEVYLTACGPLSIAFDKNFLWSKDPKEFDSQSDFIRFADINTEVAIFLGEMDIRRGDFTSRLHVLERNSLKEFKRYRNKFRVEGKTALERTSDEYVAKWTKHIESKKGFIRQYSWFQAGLQWPFVEDGSWSMPQFVNFVRQYGLSLSDVGYIPKWLDEFRDTQEFRRACSQFHK